MKPPKLNLKVVFLTHYLPPNMAGVLRALAQLVEDFEVLLSTDLEPNRDYTKSWNGLNVRVQKSWMLRQPWKHTDGGFREDLYIHVPYDTIRQLRRTDPDIVFSHELGFRSAISAFYCKLYRKKLAIYVCVTERTEQGRGFFWLRSVLRRCLVRTADAVAYNGPGCKIYLEKLGVPHTKLVYFPYAASDEFRYTGSLQRQPTARRRLIVIGQLVARKGVLPLLDALIKYSNQNPARSIELDFVGRGDQESAIRSRVLPANLMVRLLGSLKFVELAQAMEDSGVMVFPTLADEWGMVVNEAMQAGMPVIGSEFAQASTALIRPGENGWLYNPNLHDSLFEALDHLFGLSDPQLLEMRRAAQETVKDITPENVAAKAAQMFQSFMVKN